MTTVNPNDTGVFSLAADAAACDITAAAEKSHRGFRLPTPALHRGFGAVISSTATGLDAFLYDERSGPRITTYNRDSFTGFDYAQSRYYASVSGRFNTADPLASSAHPKRPGSWNRYAYVGGDPVNRNDPSGLCVEDNQYNYWDDAPPDGVWILQDYGSGACVENQTFLSQVDGDSSGVSLNGQPFNPTSGTNVGGTITFSATGTCGDDSVVGCGGSGPTTDPCYSAANSTGCLGVLGGDPTSPSAGATGQSGLAPSGPSSIHCVGSALGANGVALSLDAAGALIPLIPASPVVTGAAAISAGLAAMINSAVAGNAGGSVASIIGLQITAIQPAAVRAGLLGIARKATVLGALDAAYSFVSDISSAYQSYTTCMAGN